MIKSCSYHDGKGAEKDSFSDIFSHSKRATAIASRLDQPTQHLKNR